MPRINPYLNYWLEAANQPLGLKLTCDDPRTLGTYLYQVRVKCEPILRASIQHLQLRTSVTNPKTELWIVNAPKDARAQLLDPPSSVLTSGSQFDFDPEL